MRPWIKSETRSTRPCVFDRKRKLFFKTIHILKFYDQFPRLLQTAAHVSQTLAQSVSFQRGAFQFAVYVLQQNGQALQRRRGVVGNLEIVIR